MATYKNKYAFKGNKNINEQLVIGLAPEYVVNHESAKAWKLLCLKCKLEYGANGCDIHNRKCPECQNGTKGLAKF